MWDRGRLSLVAEIVCAQCGQPIDASGPAIMVWESGERAAYVPFVEDLRTSPEALVHVQCYVASRDLDQFLALLRAYESKNRYSRSKNPLNQPQ
jgi:hypothetical protein